MTRFFRHVGRSAARRVRGAFTLVESLLALSISALVMLGCCALLFDMVNVVEYFEKGWNLRAHADGVEKFLRASFMESVFTSRSGISDVKTTNTALTLMLAKLPSEISSTDYYLCWSVQKDAPFYVSPRGISADKVCWLVCDGDGLWIVWEFTKPEDADKTEVSIYKSLVSRWVTGVSYFYLENNSWKEEAEVSTTETSMPYFIKITFQRGEEKIERVISISGRLDFQIAP